MTVRDLSKYTYRRYRGRRRELTATVVASTAVVVALSAGCSGSGPSTDAHSTTAALAPREPTDVAATRTPELQGATYLSDLRQVPSFGGNEFDQGVIGVIGGRDLARSLRTTFCRNTWQVATYHLRRPYSTFIATVGVDDRSDPSATVQFAISVGDRVVFQQQARIGQAVVAEVSVRDADILNLSATLLSADSPCDSVAVWGRARVER